MLPCKEYDMHLSVEAHETLSLELTRDHALWTMATISRRDPSTMIRETARNTAQGGHSYRRRPSVACGT
jgi:hypothetical protein